MKSSELSPSQEQYLSDLQSWVHGKFGHIETFWNFQEAFNAHFLGYQKEKRKKLSLESLDSGHISCSGAALVAALWAIKFDEQPEPYFLISQEEDREPFHTWHVLLALPIIHAFVRDRFSEDLSAYRLGKKNNVSLIDYFRAGKKNGDRVNELRITPPEDTPHSYIFIIGLEKYFANRCKTFNYLQD